MNQKKIYYQGLITSKKGGNSESIKRFVRYSSNKRQNKGEFKVPFSIESDWFSGSTSVITYDLEELMATKLRAVYQRRKGRDLFDAWYVFSKGFANIENVATIFHAYNKYNGVKITKKQFIENLEQKFDNRDFRQDIRVLLPLDTDYNFDTAFDFVMKEVLPHI